MGRAARQEKGWLGRKSAFGLEPKKAEVPPGTILPQRTNAGKPLYWALKAVIPGHCLLTSGLASLWFQCWWKPSSVTPGQTCTVMAPVLGSPRVSQCSLLVSTAPTPEF